MGTYLSFVLVEISYFHLEFNELAKSSFCILLFFQLTTHLKFDETFLKKRLIIKILPIDNQSLVTELPVFIPFPIFYKIENFIR